MRMQQKDKAVLVDGMVYERRPDGTLAPMPSRSDWGPQDILTEAQITAAAESDPDALPMSDEAWDKAAVFKPGRGSITIRLDQDVLDYFRAQPGRYQSRINAVLRKAMETDVKAG